jgi:hypothetical protein
MDNTISFTNHVEYINKYETDLILIKHQIKSKKNKSYHDILMDDIIKIDNEIEFIISELLKLIKSITLFTYSKNEIDKILNILQEKIDIRNKKFIFFEKNVTNLDLPKQEKLHWLIIIQSLQCKIHDVLKYFMNIKQMYINKLKYLNKYKTRHHYDDHNDNNIIFEDLENNNLLKINQMQYGIRRRNNSGKSDIELLEKDISDLGKAYSKISEIVMEQNEIIIDIEKNITNTETYINAGNNELYKYFKKISSNHKFIIKLFCVIIGMILFIAIFTR